MRAPQSAGQGLPPPSLCLFSWLKWPTAPFILNSKVPCLHKSSHLALQRQRQTLLFVQRGKRGGLTSPLGKPAATEYSSRALPPSLILIW